MENKEIVIHLPLQGNKLLEKALERINSNTEIQTLWEITNINAQERLGFSDHGIIHFQIVVNSAIKIARLLLKNNIDLSVTTNFGLNYKYGELIVLLASLFHDLGMSINRHGHEEYSLFLANTLLRELLAFLPQRERTIVISETLHAIISHRAGGKPVTVEAGIVRVADALDMTKGRSRLPYEAGVINIHSVSAAGIEDVEITEGEKKPVQINILMNNSAGLFQVDDLLNAKLLGSGIEKYIAVKAYIARKTEKKLLKEFVVN